MRPITENGRGADEGEAQAPAPPSSMPSCTQQTVEAL
jgi:hypothetical protein